MPKSESFDAERIKLVGMTPQKSLETIAQREPHIGATIELVAPFGQQVIADVRTPSATSRGSRAFFRSDSVASVSTISAISTSVIGVLRELHDLRCRYSSRLSASMCG